MRPKRNLSTNVLRHWRTGALRSLLTASALLAASHATADEPVGAADLRGLEQDVTALLQEWGPCDDCSDCLFDFDGSCTVDADDLHQLLAADLPPADETDYVVDEPFLVLAPRAGTEISFYAWEDGSAAVLESGSNGIALITDAAELDLSTPAEVFWAISDPGTEMPTVLAAHHDDVAPREDRPALAHVVAEREQGWAVADGGPVLAGGACDNDDFRDRYCLPQPGYTGGICRTDTGGIWRSRKLPVRRYKARFCLHRGGIKDSLSYLKQKSDCAWNGTRHYIWGPPSHGGWRAVRSLKLTWIAGHQTPSRDWTHFSSERDSPGTVYDWASLNGPAGSICRCGSGQCAAKIIIIGCDDRRQGPIYGTRGVSPWQHVGSLTNGSTATLIGPKHLLTAAHVLLDGNNRLRTAAESFKLGQYGEFDLPYFTRNAKRVFVPRDYDNASIDPENKALDYAVIELTSAIPDSVPMDFGYITWGTVKDYVPRSIGYPGDKPDGTAWSTGPSNDFLTSPHRWIDGGERGLFYITNDGVGGQSGSPVYVKVTAGQQKVVGVLLGSPVSHCQNGRMWASRLTPTAVTRINNAINGNNDPSLRVLVYGQ